MWGGERERQIHKLVEEEGRYVKERKERSLKYRCRSTGLAQYFFKKTALTRGPHDLIAVKQEYGGSGPNEPSTYGTFQNICHRRQREKIEKDF